MTAARERARTRARPGTADDVVVFDEVSFGYGESTVLENLSLRAGRGEILGVIGPSGCGKSTLLRLISGFDRPRHGVVETNLEDNRRCPISMMFQNDTLLPWLTVRQNVLLFTRFKRWRRSLPETDLRQHGQDLLRMVHLEESADRYPYQLSGGMKRRLAFAASVAPLPQILLLDEPFSSVDEPTRIKIHQDVFDTIRSLDLTAVLVTHDLAEALTLCDRIVVLSQRPANVFAVHQVPFGKTRDVQGLRDRPDFMAKYGDVWHDLSRQL